MQLEIPDFLTNFIGGEWVAPKAGQYLDNINPATGEVFTQIPDSDAQDVDQAVEAAGHAWEGWRNTTAQQRFHYLERMASLIEANLEALAVAETTDNGKPLWLSRKVDIPRASENFRFFATAAQQFSAESHAMGNEAINYTLRQPLGTVGCISPWNLPLYLFSWKIAPALAAGNCVVAKPSEVTPLTSYFLGRIAQEAGLPPGVLNIVHGQGTGAGQAIVDHPQIKAVSFTGSTRAGAEIASRMAPSFRKLSLELGGKNPNIIFEDADWDKMMRTTLSSSFANQGQICLCGSRILVAAPIYERFREEFVARAKALVPGDPLEEGVKQGAVVSRAHYEKILGCIEQARKEGGRFLLGGHSVTLTGRCAGGYFIAPTVIEGLGPDALTNQEEIFGPVVTLQPFETEEEALSLANHSRYGLSATIWTQDLSRAHRMAASLESGIIWVNCWLRRDLRTPFGGMKQSGLGREGGWEAMRFFTEPKNVCIEL